MAHSTTQAAFVQASNQPLFGLWQPNLQLSKLFYGPNCVSKHLLDVLPSTSSKVFVITGRSLATKTPLVKELEILLGEKHAETFSEVKQHGQAPEIDSAVEKVLENGSIDTILSLGGGSPIDSAKTICYRLSQKTGTWLTHITIPTTLSAAECTPGGGYTQADGTKIGFMAPEMAVKVIFYDPCYAAFTPKSLWLSTGMRAMDHAVECLYHPYGSEIWKAQALWAAHSLFLYLPKAKVSHSEDHDVTIRLQLAAFLSSALKGTNLKGGMGLSHSLGHALGSPYGIAHGITSCLTLPKVVKMKALASKEDASQIMRLLPATGGHWTGDAVKDACTVADRIEKLVDNLGFSEETLTKYGVSRDEIPTITKRACGHVTEGSMYDGVYKLVDTLF